MEWYNFTLGSRGVLMVSVLGNIESSRMVRIQAFGGVKYYVSFLVTRF